MARGHPRRDGRRPGASQAWPWRRLRRPANMVPHGAHAQHHGRPAAAGKRVGRAPRRRGSHIVLRHYINVDKLALFIRHLARGHRRERAAAAQRAKAALTHFLLHLQRGRSKVCWVDKRSAKPCNDVSGVCIRMKPAITRTGTAAKPTPWQHERGRDPGRLRHAVAAHTANDDVVQLRPRQVGMVQLEAACVRSGANTDEALCREQTRGKAGWAAGGWARKLVGI